jgi:hypothetical protein
MSHVHVRVMLAVAGLLVATGCASDGRPKYVRPDLPKGQYATIEPTVGAFSGVKTEVDEVDGARVAGFLETYDVRVAPGEHVIRLRVQQGTSTLGGGHAIAEGGLKFRFTFLAGHVYEVGFNTRGNRRPILRDKTERTLYYLDESPQRVEQ